MLTLLTGLPRNGKSFRALLLLLDCLRNDNRPIYTNLPLMMDQLAAYCDRKGIPRHQLDRIHFLSTDEVGVFWRCRPKPPVVNLDIKGKALPGKPALEFVEDGGVVYFIDEAHTKFKTHDWDKLGDEAPFYISQHGHLEDDVILITQHVDKLVKQMKLDVQHYEEIEYMRRQHWLFFQKGYHFKRKVWTAGIPETRMEKPNNIGVFWPDKRLMACYDSRAGHGITRISASHGDARFRGLPPFVAWGLMAACGFLCLQLLFKAPAYILNKVRGGKTSASQPAAKSGAAAPASGAALPFGASAKTGDQSVPLPADLERLRIYPDTRPQTPLMIRGMSWMERDGQPRLSVLLSDGRTLTEFDREIREIKRNFIRLKDGTKLWLDERGLPDPAVPPAPDSKPDAPADAAAKSAASASAAAHSVPL